MKKLLLLGDSIRMGYDSSVKKALEGRAEVIFPEENCRFAEYLFRNLHEYLYNAGGGETIDVVHWNVGLWDTLRLCGEDNLTPIDVYEYYIDRISARMKKLCPNAKIIFATSTLIDEDRMRGVSLCGCEAYRSNSDTAKYNDAALDVIGKYGFEVDDLYSLSASLPLDAHSDATHYYTPMGTKAFTDKVLPCVAPALGITEPLEYIEKIYTDGPVGI